MDITVTISDLQSTILLDELLNIQGWVQDAIDGKANKVKKRMLAEWQPKLFADSEVDNIPANEDAFINLVLSRPTYKNREQRELEE